MSGVDPSAAPALPAMAPPKRKAPGGPDSTASPAGAAKRARAAEELTGVRFKAQLREPQGAGPGECGAGLPAWVGEGSPCTGHGPPFRAPGSEPHLPASSRDPEAAVLRRPRPWAVRDTGAAQASLVVTVPGGCTRPGPGLSPSAESETSLWQS